MLRLVFLIFSFLFSARKKLNKKIHVSLICLFLSFSFSLKLLPIDSDPGKRQEHLK